MKLKFPLLFLPLFFISCSGQNCEALPGSYNSYEEATNQIRQSQFTFEEELKSIDNESSWITGAEFYSCDGSTGYLIIEMQGKHYLFNNFPKSEWQEFKGSESKSKFYHEFIRGKYNFELK